MKPDEIRVAAIRKLDECLEINPEYKQSVNGLKMLVNNSDLLSMTLSQVEPIYKICDIFNCFSDVYRDNVGYDAAEKFNDLIADKKFAKIARECKSKEEMTALISIHPCSRYDDVLYYLNMKITLEQEFRDDTKYLEGCLERLRLIFSNEEHRNKFVCKLGFFTPRKEMTDINFLIELVKYPTAFAEATRTKNPVPLTELNPKLLSDSFQIVDWYMNELPTNTPPKHGIPHLLAAIEKKLSTTTKFIYPITDNTNELKKFIRRTNMDIPKDSSLYSYILGSIEVRGSLAKLNTISTQEQINPDTVLEILQRKDNYVMNQDDINYCIKLYNACLFLNNNNLNDQGIYFADITMSIMNTLIAAVAEGKNPKEMLQHDIRFVEGTALDDYFNLSTQSAIISLKQSIDYVLLLASEHTPPINLITFENQNTSNILKTKFSTLTQSELSEPTKAIINEKIMPLLNEDGTFKNDLNYDEAMSNLNEALNQLNVLNHNLADVIKHINEHMINALVMKYKFAPKAESILVQPQFVCPEQLCSALSKTFNQEEIEFINAEFGKLSPNVQLRVRNGLANTKTARAFFSLMQLINKSSSSLINHLEPAINNSSKKNKIAACNKFTICADPNVMWDNLDSQQIHFLITHPDFAKFISTYKLPLITLMPFDRLHSLRTTVCKRSIFKERVSDQLFGECISIVCMAVSSMTLIAHKMSEVKQHFDDYMTEDIIRFIASNERVRQYINDNPQHIVPVINLVRNAPRAFAFPNLELFFIVNISAKNKFANKDLNSYLSLANQFPNVKSLMELWPQHAEIICTVCAAQPAGINSNLSDNDLKKIKFMSHIESKLSRDFLYFIAKNNPSQNFINKNRNVIELITQQPELIKLFMNEYSFDMNKINDFVSILNTHYKFDLNAPQLNSFCGNMLATKDSSIWNHYFKNHIANNIFDNLPLIYARTSEPNLNIHYNSLLQNDTQISILLSSEDPSKINNIIASINSKDKNLCNFYTNVFDTNSDITTTLSSIGAEFTKKQTTLQTRLNNHKITQEEYDFLLINLKRTTKNYFAKQCENCIKNQLFSDKNEDKPPMEKISLVSNLINDYNTQSSGQYSEILETLHFAFAKGIFYEQLGQSKGEAIKQDNNSIIVNKGIKFIADIENSSYDDNIKKVCLNALSAAAANVVIEISDLKFEADYSKHKQEQLHRVPTRAEIKNR